MARTALSALCAGVSAGVVFVGCSASGGGELSFEDWQAEVTAVCEAYEPRLAEAQASHSEVHTAEEAVALFDTAIPILQEYNRTLAAVGMPSERAADVAELLYGLEIEERRVLELRQALFDRDVGTFERLIAEQDSGYENVNAKASELGVPACDSRDASATSA